MDKGINDRLRTVRKALALNQKEMAETIGVAQGTYCQYEKGVRVFQPRYVKTLERTFSVNPDWLVKGEGDMFLPSKDDEAMFRLYYDLTDSNKELINQLVEELLKAQNSRR